MSRPTIIAGSGTPRRQLRSWGNPEPIRTTVGVEVRVEFDNGEHDAALAALEHHVDKVKAQIAESHAPTWDGPRKVGEEPDNNEQAERREPIHTRPVYNPGGFTGIEDRQ